MSGFGIVKFAGVWPSSLQLPLQGAPHGSTLRAQHRAWRQDGSVDGKCLTCSPLLDRLQRATHKMAGVLLVSA